MEVDCFSSRGKLLWSYVPREAFRFGDRELKGLWSVHDLMISHAGPKRWIWVMAVHEIWGNGFVVRLDPATGRSEVRFVNSGVLYSLQELHAGSRTFLLAGGFNNEYEAGSLAVVDEAKAFAASPQSDGNRTQCTSCFPGSPDYYFVFPRSEINVLAKEWLDAVRGLAIEDEDIRVSKCELSRDMGASAIYELRLEPEPRILSLQYSSTYEQRHREIEHEGRIHHTFDKCPERLSPRPVKMWTRAAGWSELRIRPENR